MTAKVVYDYLFRNNIAWFVDFFAPWCPPCMQLLPEFRKAARTQVRGRGGGGGSMVCQVYYSF